MTGDVVLRPLRPGDALTSWQLSPTRQERFDVADRPMTGDMDARFFLTSHKNFVPHEYPCRTEFAARFRDLAPLPTISFEPARWWFPFGDTRVDLSGFWFRATTVETLARTVLPAETAGRATVRLVTCGAALLRVNGVDAGWLAPYQRNLESECQIVVDLVAGDNVIDVWFADLCERDTRYMFQLDYLDGPAAALALPVPIPAPRVEAIERLLSGLRFERSFYTEGTVVLVLPEPVASPLRAEIDLSGDAVLPENLTVARPLDAGATRLEIAPVADLPADFLYATVHLIDGPFRLARRLAVEVCDVAAQGEPPAALAERIDEALDHVAREGASDCVRALARLAVGMAGAETDAMIAACLPLIRDCHDCADFQLVPLLWARLRYGDRIGAETRATIDDTILGYRYWLDEPGNDVQWFFSENHALLFHTACYLAGGLFPDAVFRRSGRLGTEQRAVGRARLLAWLDHFEACEMAEWNSAPYFPIDLKGLCTLHALAPDADIRDRAERAILRLLEIVALSSHQGLLTASQGRSYEHSLRPARTSELSAMARLLWRRGWFGHRVHALPQLALCLRDHGLNVPDALAAFACYSGDMPLTWRFKQGEGGFAALHHHKNRHVALGTLIGYRAGLWGYQETVLHGRLGERPEAQFWINHPGEVLVSGSGRPSYWGGCGTLPEVWAHRGLAVLRFSVRPEQPPFTHLWLPEDAMDEVVLDGDRLLVRSGTGLALYIGAGPLSRVTSGPTARSEIRQDGRDTLWLVRVSDVVREGSLAAFGARMGDLRATAAADGGLSLTDTDYGAVLCHPGGATTVAGVTHDHQGWSMAGALVADDGREIALPSRPR